MNTPYTTQIMPLIRAWLSMPLASAKPAMRAYMLLEGEHSALDFDLLERSEDTFEAIGLIFGV